jgi:RNA polymerase sigma-70 factor (ECF subfamily)
MRATPLDVSSRTDEQLAAVAAREGSDGPAFQCLLGRFRQRVWRICFRLMGNETDTNDAAQEVFVQLFLNRGKFEGRSKYSTWVHGISVRTCLMLRRSIGRRRKYEITDPEEHHTTGAESKKNDPEIALDLMRILETLNENDRAMLILKHAEGYSYEELADMFSLSVSACKMRLSRAKDKLKQRFPGQL